jgi:hypothetical protein
VELSLLATNVAIFKGSVMSLPSRGLLTHDGFGSPTVPEHLVYRIGMLDGNQESDRHVWTEPYIWLYIVRLFGANDETFRGKRYLHNMMLVCRQGEFVRATCGME